MSLHIKYVKSHALDAYDAAHNGVNYPVWPAEVDVVLSNPNGSHYRRSFEFIDDNSAARYQPWVEHECQHYKCYGELVQGSPVGLDRLESFNLSLSNTMYYRGRWALGFLPVPSSFGTTSEPFEGLGSLYAGSSDKDYSITMEYNPDNMIRAAWSSLIPRIAPKLLLLSELYQLKDTKPSVVRTLRRALHLEQDLNPALKILGRVGPLKRILRLGRKFLALPADLFLQWKFNVQPTIEDIAAIHAALSEVRSKVKVYLEAGRHRRTAYYSCPLDSFYPDSSEMTVLPTNVYKFHYGLLSSPWLPVNTTDVAYDRIYRTCNYTKAVFHAKVEYSFEYPEAWQKYAELDSLTNLLGLGTSPLRDIWEIIPWSFVVDWLLHVNKWLEQFDTEAGKPFTIIHKWCWSHHVKRRTQVRYRLSANAGKYYPAWSYQTDAPVGTWWEDAYLRSTHGTSGYSSLIASAGLTEGQLVLATALGLTR